MFCDRVIKTRRLFPSSVMNFALSSQKVSLQRNIFSFAGNLQVSCGKRSKLKLSKVLSRMPGRQHETFKYYGCARETVRTGATRWAIAV
jgi:hypothetical protein